MKKYFLLFLLFSALISQAQDYIIKFSGTGASGSVDQVIVENITQNKKIILAKNQYLHLTGNNNNVVQTKSSVSYKTTSANEITMLFKDGDRMRFTGSSGDYSTVISDSPKQSKNFTFRFIS
ncbi:MAG: hypothetical protein JXR31_12810 [Prolixibacteraceae bacterium]|nr:hypothetical protein [Prolixibacteraceae bacterium]